MLICDIVRAPDLALIWPKTHDGQITTRPLFTEQSDQLMCADDAEAGSLSQLQPLFLTMHLGKDARTRDRDNDFRPDIETSPPPPPQNDPTQFSNIAFFTVRNSDHLGAKS